MSELFFDNMYSGQYFYNFTFTEYKMKSVLKL